MIANNIIKSKIPDFIKSYPNTVAYLMAMGDFMDDTRGFIEQFKYHADYKRGSNFNIANSLRSEGVELPLNSENIPRIILRDLFHNFVRKGTIDSFTWILDILDVEYKIYQAWIPNPEFIQIGYYKDFESDGSGEEFIEYFYVDDDYVDDDYVEVIREQQESSLRRYNVTEISYKDFLYGESYVDANGNTYFRGNPYDSLGGSDISYYIENGYIAPSYFLPSPAIPFIYEGIPIYGESYPVIQEEQNRVASSPYTLMRLSLPEEPSELTSFLIDTFVKDKNRPTNGRLIVELV